MMGCRGNLGRRRKLEPLREPAPPSIEGTRRENKKGKKRERERERERKREKRARADRLDRLLWSFVKVNEKEKMSEVEEGRELPQRET
ncbi:hypothetical protein HZH68_008963 [Vespula germanica]|uniref:Uncharacterized protein n=1 Tax=Vespula germanica TaxID=30212 RepID=A0A834K5N5_VESGE|nr:hypothetical protein HZH68_008963 [Vespula germanica]